MDPNARVTPAGCSRASRPSTTGWARCSRSARTRGGAGSSSSKVNAVPGVAGCSTSRRGTGLVARELAREATFASSVSTRARRCSAPGLAGRSRTRARRRGSGPTLGQARGAAVRRRDVRRGDVHLPAAVRRRPGRDRRASSRASCGPAGRWPRSSSTCRRHPAARAGGRVHARRRCRSSGWTVSPAWRRTGRFLGPSISRVRRARPAARAGALVAGGGDASRADRAADASAPRS